MLQEFLSTLVTSTPRIIWRAINKLFPLYSLSGIGATRERGGGGRERGWGQRETERERGGRAERERERQAGRPAGRGRQTDGETETTRETNGDRIPDRPLFATENVREKDVSATRIPTRLGEGQSRNKLVASGQIVLNDMKGAGQT